MNKISERQHDYESQTTEEMLDEYDFSQGVRGKFYQKNLSHDQKRLVKIKTKDGDREVMMRTIETKAIITHDGQMTVQVPADITPGEHRIVLMIEESTIMTTSPQVTDIDKGKPNEPE